MRRRRTVSRTQKLRDLLGELRVLRRDLRLLGHPVERADVKLYVPHSVTVRHHVEVTIHGNPAFKVAVAARAQLETKLERVARSLRDLGIPEDLIQEES